MRVIRFRVEAPVAALERLSAELFALGTQGIEERPVPDAPSRAELLAYFPADSGVALAVQRLGEGAREVRVEGPDPVPEEDWERRWREGLAPRRIGPLWIRPSWCASPGRPELRIDPRQAFGSGEHATTRLALGLALEALHPGDRVLDLGTGSGILALAALRLGAGWTVGVDLDTVACWNARDNASENALPLRLVCGTLDALAPDAAFDLVLANLLFSRLRPWLPRLARHAGRALVLAGFLERERPSVRAALAELGMPVSRETSEEQGGDTWGACLAHAALHHSSS